jgi:hypothetical protein
MNSNRLYSKQAQKMIKLALSDAAHYSQSNDAEEAEQELYAKISSFKSGADLYQLKLGLGYSSNFRSRASFGQLIGGAPYPVNLIDCWKLRLLEVKILEKSSMHYAKELKTLATLFEERRVHWLPDQIHELAFDIFKLYLTGQENYIKEMACFFELFDLRGDAASITMLKGEKIQPYNISVCVNLLIAREKADPVSVGKLLESIPIFKGITEFWEDDAEFARWTERAAQWHLEYCPKNFSKFEDFANVAPDVLVPSWILALDKFRQKHLGRPCCLGEHELLALSQEVISAAKAQNYPKLPALIAAEKFYKDQFGDDVFNPVPFWEAFMASEG